MAIRFDDIGNRLKAFRLGSGLSADEIANRLGISRTALYRFEKGELAKIETLEKLAELLVVSVPTLLGVGVEYVASAVELFRAHAADRGDLRAHHRARRPDLLSARLRCLRPRARRHPAREHSRRAAEGRKRALEQVDEIIDRAAPAQGNLPPAPARHRQPDLGDRDGALPEQRPGRPARPAREDPPASGARWRAPRPSISRR